MKDIGNRWNLFQNGNQLWKPDERRRDRKWSRGKQQLRWASRTSPSKRRYPGRIPSSPLRLRAGERRRRLATARAQVTANSSVSSSWAPPRGFPVCNAVLSTSDATVPKRCTWTSRYRWLQTVRVWYSVSTLRPPEKTKSIINSCPISVLNSKVRHPCWNIITN